MEDDLKTKMEDDLKKKWKKMEDEPKKNGSRPQKKEEEKKMEDDLKKNLKMKTTTNKNLFSIPLKFRPNLSWDWLSSLRFLFFLGGGDKKS